MCARRPGGCIDSDCTAVLRTDAKLDRTTSALCGRASSVHKCSPSGLSYLQVGTYAEPARPLNPYRVVVPRRARGALGPGTLPTLTVPRPDPFTNKPGVTRARLDTDPVVNMQNCVVKGPPSRRTGSAQYLCIGRTLPWCQYPPPTRARLHWIRLSRGRDRSRVQPAWPSPKVVGIE